MKIIMENNYQNPKDIAVLIKSKLINNPRRSISRLFTKLRRYQRLLSYGDLYILFLVVSAFIELKMKLDRSQLLYAYNKSAELKDNSKNTKEADIDQLLKPYKSTEIQYSHRQKTTANGKADQFSINNYSQNVYA